MGNLKTTAGRRWSGAIILLASCLLIACDPQHAPEHETEEEEAIARTEFTGRIENFFEYAPLKAGKTSQFLIHLTDLSDGSPVEKAEVTLTIRNEPGTEVDQIKSKVGRVTGIYVADVSLDKPGDYQIEFHVKSTRIDERMALKDFSVE